MLVIKTKEELKTLYEMIKEIENDAVKWMVDESLNKKLSSIHYRLGIECTPSIAGIEICTVTKEISQTDIEALQEILFHIRNEIWRMNEQLLNAYKYITTLF